jgi:hypothetical protein
MEKSSDLTTDTINKVDRLRFFAGGNRIFVNDFTFQINKGEGSIGSSNINSCAD